jgi:hypothetical protein
VSRNGQRRGENGSTDESAWSRFWSNARATKPIASAVLLITLLVSAVAAMERLQRRVESEPEMKLAVRVELDLPPDADWVDKEGWRPRILSVVHLPEEQTYTDENLLQNVARQMMKSGWVSQVDRVVRMTDGTIRVLCQYRRPIAMLLTDEPGSKRPVYLPIDRQGYRLPEVYTDISGSGSWIQILGVRCKPPEVGQQFEAEDARAAVRLASLIFQQSFHSQVAAVDVTNFRGRVDRARDHILIHPRKGRPIVWGSAVGDEIEEPSAPDKLRMLGKYFASGSPQAYIDLSVYSNAGIEKMPESLPRANVVASTSSRKQ